jgi:hypothetical protein
MLGTPRGILMFGLLRQNRHEHDTKCTDHNSSNYHCTECGSSRAGFVKEDTSSHFIMVDKSLVSTEHIGNIYGYIVRNESLFVIQRLSCQQTPSPHNDGVRSLSIPGITECVVKLRA